MSGYGRFQYKAEVGSAVLAESDRMNRRPKRAISTGSHGARDSRAIPGQAAKARERSHARAKSAPPLPGHDISAQEPSNLKETFSLAR